MIKPKVLLLDIETAPIVADVWQIWDVNVGLNQIRKDWSVLSWAAKWLEDKDSDVMYADTSKQRNKRDDRRILKPMWKLLNECDIVITQNGDRFDIPKLNARFIKHGMKRYAPIRSIDTRKLAKSRFGFTSNSLEYMAKFLGVRFRKLTKRKYVGHDLWTECLKGNQDAWKEMKKYNIRDVNVLQGVYEKLQSWKQPVQFYHGTKCNCGSKHVTKRGYAVSNTGKFEKFQCQGCGAWFQGKENLLSKKQRKAQRKPL